MQNLFATTFFVLFLTFNISYAASGYFGNCGTFIELNSVTYKVGGCTSGDPAFVGTNLGTVTSLTLGLVQQFTFENGGDDIFNGTLNYRIYPSGAAPTGSYSTVSLTNTTLLGGGDEQRVENPGTNLLTGLLASTQYTLEVFFSADGSNGGFNFSIFENCGDSNTNCRLTFTTDAALPVELTTFSAKSIQNRVALSWTTASEFNNSHFEVERSYNSKVWIPIGKVIGSGTTLETQRYRFQDLTPHNGINYYRLKQMDIDGTYEYSEVLVVSLEKAKGSVTIYPTVVEEQLTVENGIGEAAIYNQLGQLIRKDQLTTFVSQVDVSGLVRGQYILLITTDQGKKIVEKFVK